VLRGANRDAALMTVAAVPLWPLGLPIFGVGSLLTLAFSRAREFAADRGAALITGRPEALMSALTKLAGPHASPAAAR
jgi:heat shock protein HtpX